MLACMSVSTYTAVHLGRGSCIQVLGSHMSSEYNMENLVKAPFPENPELAAHHRRVRAARYRATHLTSGLTNKQVHWQPEASRWSIAQCLQHLVVTGRKMVPRLAWGIAEARRKGWLSPGPFRYGWLSTWLVQQVSYTGGPPRRRFRAPRAYHPMAYGFEGFPGRTDHSFKAAKRAGETGQPDRGLRPDAAGDSVPTSQPDGAGSPVGACPSLDGLLRDFFLLQDHLQGLMEKADGVDLARIKVTSAASRWLRLSLGLWFALLVGHQERHLAQAERVRKQADFPSGR